MHMNRRAALLAAAMPLHVQLETKEVGDPDLKKAVDDLGQVITDFRKKNDDRLSALEKGREDVITKADVEKINAAIDKAIAEVKKRTDEVEAKANRLQLVSGGDADREIKAAKAFAELVSKADFSVEELREYKGALGHFLRRNEAKVQTLAIGQDPAGGYLVTPDTSGRMVQKIYETTPMRQLANVVPIGTDMLQGPIDNGEADAAWVGEVTTRTQTDTPTLGMWEIPVFELYAYPKVTQRLLEDAKIDVEAWLGDKASSKFARKENTAFITGNGVLKPRGILDYTAVTTADDTRTWGQFQYIATGTDNSFGATTNGSDKILDLIFELKAAYRQVARFLMSRRTMAGVRKLKDGQGNYAYGLGLKEGALVETVFGYGVTDGEDMPLFSASTPLAIAFGDFNEAYTIVDRLGISVIRDNITTPGFVKFNMRKRVGGGAVNFEAVKFLKFASA